MNKNRINKMIGIAIPLLFIIIGICCSGFIRTHTFTLSGDEHIQPLTGTVKVSSTYDTKVAFTDVDTGVKYEIDYITSGKSETVYLEKGKWYSFENGEGLTIRPVNVRVE